MHVMFHDIFHGFLISEPLAKLTERNSLQSTVFAETVVDSSKLLDEWDECCLLLFDLANTGDIRRSCKSDDIVYSLQNLLKLKNFQIRCPHLRKIVMFVLLFNPSNAQSERLVVYTK